MMRRYPRIDGPAALPLFCLAPHGVFRASRIASRAVSSYLAFSPLPALFSKNRRCLFCDTFRQPRLGSGLPTCSTWHAAVWCSDFPPANPAKAGLTSDHLPSARILAQRRPKKRKPRITRTSRTPKPTFGPARDFRRRPHIVLAAAKIECIPDGLREKIRDGSRRPGSNKLYDRPTQPGPPP